MSDSPFDPKNFFETYRTALAPALKSSRKAQGHRRLGRYQYAVAGDYLEWSLAQVKAVPACKRLPSWYPSN